MLAMKNNKIVYRITYYPETDEYEVTRREINEEGYDNKVSIKVSYPFDISNCDVPADMRDFIYNSFSIK